MRQEALLAIPLQLITSLSYGGECYSVPEDQTKVALLMEALSTVDGVPSALVAAARKTLSEHNIDRQSGSTIAAGHGIQGVREKRASEQLDPCLITVVCRVPPSLVTMDKMTHDLHSCTHVLRASKSAEAIEWGEALSQVAREMRDRQRRRFIREHGWSERLRTRLDKSYRDPRVQAVLLLIILGCFVSSIASTTVTEEDQTDEYRAGVKFTELGFTLFFFLELLFNLAGSIRVGDSMQLIARDAGRWVCSGWNMLDTIVVVASMALLSTDQSAVGYLRTIRVLRLVKILRWFEHLNRIVRALFSSLVPVASSLILVSIIL